VRDTTDRHISEGERQRQHDALELKIKERTSQLQQSNKELEAFSYSVSHDLRAPLRIINGYAKLLSNEHAEKFSSEGKEFMDAIIDNTKYMGRLIDDLLNLSRLGREAVHNSLVDMNTVVHVGIHEMKMKEEVITADISVGDLHASICDQQLIKQVWVNLISNAIKYSRKKSNPKIEIGSYEKDGSTVYYIKDNGAGFDMKFSTKLFGVFSRLHDRAEFDGTGVGLALVHRLITKLNGKVWATGKVDEGATFYFSLPK
jgi:light-regulated signal transduction histidine kinase (bacteriophytochrome)